jgi:hypothetical protein
VRVERNPASRGVPISRCGAAAFNLPSGVADNRDPCPGGTTANLYSATQPGGSLYGLNNSNPFNPAFQPQGTGIGRVPGGIITFGGGVPLYSAGKVIRGLGVSGDSACADHVIAYRMRRGARLDGIPAGVGFHGTDNIDFLGTNEQPNGFKHPHCFPQDIPSGSI